MYIKSIKGKNYRNYDDIDITLSKNLNIFLGENAQGKTNLAEALYFIGTLKSHRTSRNKELIKWNENDTYIKASIYGKFSEDIIEVFISLKEKNYVKINGVKATKATDVLGRLNIVMFSPEDLKLVKEGPSIRRKFIDFELCQIRPKYHYLINRYNKILSQRNNILRSLQFSKDLESTFEIFTDQLIEVAAEVIIMRNDFLDRINKISYEIHSKITNGLEELEISYICDVKNFSSKENIKNELINKFKSKKMLEIKKGYSLVGPHKDDILIKVNSVDTRIFGSQGQQRSAALSLKLSEIEIINSIKGEYPILILDDVLSELDENRQKYLINNLKHLQTILTCTSGSDIDLFESENKNIFHVKEGFLTLGQ